MKLIHVLIVALSLASASFGQNITGTVTGRATDRFRVCASPPDWRVSS